MKGHEFEQAEPLVDDIAEIVGEMIDHEILAELKNKLSEISRFLGEPYSVSLDVNLQIFDSDRQKSLPLMQTGLTTSKGAPPYRCWDDSSPHRYVVDGQLSIVPNDYCPACWGLWYAKDHFPACPECGVKMGDQIKWMLDNDVCPNCEEGTVSPSDPTCAGCGYSVNPAFILWG